MHNTSSTHLSSNFLFSRGVLGRALLLAGLWLGVFGGAPTLSAQGLLSNHDFTEASSDPSWPEHWNRPKAGSVSWDIEGERRYVRMSTSEPGQNLLMYRIVKVPADAKALEISLTARVIGLKCGPQPWFDARVMADFKSATGEKVRGAKTISFRKDTDDWVERRVRFLVPEGGVAIEIMPTLFNVYSGTFDIDLLQVSVIDPELVNTP